MLVARTHDNVEMLLLTFSEARTRAVCATSLHGIGPASPGGTLVQGRCARAWLGTTQATHQPFDGIRKPGLA
jgi:hypothetical protein